jgi:hypothetical protein
MDLNIFIENAAATMKGFLFRWVNFAWVGFDDPEFVIGYVVEKIDVSVMIVILQWECDEYQSDVRLISRYE